MCLTKLNIIKDRPMDAPLHGNASQIPRDPKISATKTLHLKFRTESIQPRGPPAQLPSPARHPLDFGNQDTSPEEKVTYPGRTTKNR